MGKFLLKAFFLFAAVLVLAELLLRGAFLLTFTPQQFVERKLERSVHRAIWLGWTNPNQTDPFQPPYVVFSNTGLSDQDRLRRVFEATKLEPNKEWISSDFLRPETPAEKTAYKIHSNSMGFRGRETKPEKGKNVVRVIAVGDYHVFGHGVNDEETYPAKLEQILNSKPRKLGLRYEVWNVGRHASTAIVGLAKLKFELLSYKPDFFIFDYGFVDGGIHEDNTLPATLLFQNTLSGNALRGIAHRLIPVLVHSELFFAAMRKFALPPRNYLQNLDRFQATMTEILKICEENKIPAIVVNEFGIGIPASSFQTFMPTSGTSELLDVSEYFYYHPPTIEQEKAFSKSQNWLSRIPEKFRRHSLNMDYAPYRTDIYQLSPLGNQVVAQALSEIILKKGK